MVSGRILKQVEEMCRLAKVGYNSPRPIYLKYTRYITMCVRNSIVLKHECGMVDIEGIFGGFWRHSARAVWGLLAAAPGVLVC